MDLEKVNQYFDRAMPYITPVGVAVGLLTGSYFAPLKPFVPYLFAFVTFTGALGMSFKAFGAALSRRKLIVLSLVYMHLLLPLVIWALANLFFPSRPEIVMGFVVLSSGPIAVSSFIWCSINKGDGPLALSLILIDTLLAPLFTPAIIRLLASSDIAIDASGIMKSLFIMVVIPSILGMLFNQFSHTTARKVVPVFKPFTKIMILFVIIINISQVSDAITLNWESALVIVVNLLVLLISFTAIYSIAKYVLKEDRDSVVTLTFSTGMRNINAALVLVTTFFPPLSSLPVIFGILLQQTAAAITGAVLFSRKKQI